MASILKTPGVVIGKTSVDNVKKATVQSGNPPAGTYEIGGERKQGYIKNGVTYTDPDFTNEVPVGSKVYTNDGIFIKSGGGSLKVDKPPVSATAPAKATANSGTPVTYTVDGVVHKGYLKDGYTYTDDTYSTRVPIGAIEHTGGGTYEMTANGGVPTSQTQINDFKRESSTYLDAYKAAQTAQEKQIDANVRAAINRLNEQKNAAEEAKKEADRVAYNTYLRAVNPYGANAQQVASLGLGNSGFSETNLASMGNEYQEAMSRARLERDAAIRNINLQIEEARLSGDMEKAAALSAYAQNLANMGLSIAQTNASIAQNAANAAYTRSRDAVADNRYADETEYSRNQDKIALALQLMQMGLSMENAAKVLGVSESEFAAMVGYYARQIKGK